MPIVQPAGVLPVCEPEPVIMLVLGGARSGKSRHAEQLVARSVAARHVRRHGCRRRGGRRPSRRGCAAHRARRDPAWTTIEAGADLAAALRTVAGSVLVDSLGTWVAAHDDFAVDVDELCKALCARDGDTVVVSEEVGLGVHPSSAVGQRFRDVLGEVNAAVADIADDVLLVIAGRVLPLERG